MVTARKATTRKPRPVVVEDQGDAPIANPDGSPVVAVEADEAAPVEGSA